MKILFVLICVIGMMFVTACSKQSANQVEEVVETPVVSATPEVMTPELEYYNKMQTDSRPIAVMIDNDSDKARPQLGLESADVVYEIIVEGGATRFMALFKGNDLEKVGPIRSSRHYFLDYALEHDAIYTHAGWSPKASKDISSFGVNNINGILGTDGKIFWRDKTYDKTWHNLYTGLDKVHEMAVSTKQYSDKTDVKHLEYYKEDTELGTETLVNKIKLPYSAKYSVNYEYDPESKMYKRFVNSKEHMSQTGDCIKVKNIIVYKVENVALNDGENKGRQDLKNVGSGTGYYITNGKVVDINWSKSSRTAKTVYTLADGTNLTVNPGNTYIQILPMNSNITFE